MTDAATKLAEEILEEHTFGDTNPKSCIVCSAGRWDVSWPCDAVRAADMLLGLAMDGERWRAFVELAMPEQWNGARLSWAPNRGLYVVTVGSGYEIGVGPTAEDAIDAARNATQEKPNE